jgi:phosphate transport system substrate-binding protein
VFSQSFGTYPHLDGSTVCIPLAVEFARQHLGMDDEAATAIAQFNTTALAYDILIHKEQVYSGTVLQWTDPATGRLMDWETSSDMCFYEHTPVDLLLGTEPSNDELQLARQQGVELVKEPICYDAFVFITHKDNPVSSLTLDQLRAIYSGRITNWKEVGGSDQAIVAFQREPNSGSQTAMENLVMQGTPMASPLTVKEVVGMGALVDAVAEYRNNANSLGYTYQYYVQTLYKSSDIKILDIEGITPTAAQVVTGAYPLATAYYGVIRSEDADKPGGLFLDWILTPEGQQCVKQAGYIPLRP